MATPVVFIHGLWLHATSWDAWQELFADRGYDPVAPGWPGDGADVVASRAHPGPIADRGIDEVTEHFARIVGDLPEPPVIIGHSFGGLIAQKLLTRGQGAAAIAIDAAQIRGVRPVPLSTLRATFPVFRNPANRHRAVSLTADQFAYAFGNAVPRAESDALHERWTIPAPARPLFEAAIANVARNSPAQVDTATSDRGPLLLVMGGRDHTIPEKITTATAKLYRHSSATTDVRAFDDRGHSLTIDSGWREVADGCLDWLAATQR